MANDKVQAIKDSMDVYVTKLCKELKEGHTENFKSYLSVVSKFHSYSFSNQMLIASQMSTASKVAGFQTWKKLGRSVKAGSKSIKILAPRIGKRADESGNEESFIKYFGLVSVFDISQTEGDELPKWHHSLGEDTQNIFGRLKTIMEKKGILVEEREIAGGALGASYGGRVAIDPKLDPKNKALTLIHEFAHEILHKGSENVSLSRGFKECQAEATTFIVASYFGEESPFSKDYLLNWGNGEAELRENLTSVIKASQEIINLLSDSTEIVENTFVNDQKIAA